MRHPGKHRKTWFQSLSPSNWFFSSVGKKKCGCIPTQQARKRLVHAFSYLQTVSITIITWERTSTLYITYPHSSTLLVEKSIPNIIEIFHFQLAFAQHLLLQFNAPLFFVISVLEQFYATAQYGSVLRILNNWHDLVLHCFNNPKLYPQHYTIWSSLNGSTVSR